MNGFLQRVVDFEEAEALSRPAEKDANLFKKICQDIRQLFADISELKDKNSDEVCILPSFLSLFS